MSSLLERVQDRNLVKGIRFNNPTNLRHVPANKWAGLDIALTESHGGGFCIFKTMVDGLSAGLQTLITYRSKYGFDTVSEIVSKWAPPNENLTGAYINSVAQALGVGVDEKLNLPVYRELGRSSLDLRYLELLKAIVRHECGAKAVGPTESDYLEAGKIRGLKV